MENSSSHDIDLIECYLDGTMPENERKSFEMRLKQDDDFRDLFIFRKKTQELFSQAHQLEETRLFVSRILKKTSGRNKRLIRYSIAAGFLVVFGLWGMIKIFNGQGSEDLSVYSALKKDSIQYSTNQLQKYLPEEKGNHYESCPSYSPGDTIELSFKRSDREHHHTTLIIVRSQTLDTVLTARIRPEQNYYRLLPGKLSEGQYKWKLSETSRQGAFIIRER
ncbi:MAG: hypothetical protein AB2L24_05770 [Mangrovibacterium sp.]